MGILEAAKPVIVICTRDRERTAAFYKETLRLTMAYRDNLAAVFNVDGVTLRVSTVADFVPHEHTVLGFNVPNVETTIRSLRENGVTFNNYKGFNQDEFAYLECARRLRACGMVQRSGWQRTKHNEHLKQSVDSVKN